MAKRTKPTIPNFIYCSITGQRFAVRRDVLLQRIKAAGSLERLQKTYVSRDARRLLKEGKTIDEIRKELGYDPTYANSNLTDHAAKSSSSMARVRVHAGQQIDTFWRSEAYRINANWDKGAINVAETTKEACLMPNRWLDHDCPGCKYFKECTLLTKGVYRK